MHNNMMLRVIRYCRAQEMDGSSWKSVFVRRYIINCKRATYSFSFQCACLAVRGWSADSCFDNPPAAAVSASGASVLLLRTCSSSYHYFARHRGMFVVHVVRTPGTHHDAVVYRGASFLSGCIEQSIHHILGLLL